MDSARSENRPTNYDSGDEWEIGLGNLIIDLDADLEKDKHDGSSTKGGNCDSSPLRIGKMKIKRKVNSLKGDSPSNLDLKELCNPSEVDQARTEENVSQSTSKGPTAKSGGMKGGGSSKDVTKGDTHVEHKKGSSAVDSASAKAGTGKHSDVKETVSSKSTKSSEKSSDDTRKKEGSKRSSDGTGTRKPSGKRPKLDKSSNCSIGVDTMEMGTITEPESLGPCEPGTSVTLEGIVWHENDQGVLVVNVTWRNKTYVGTLLDCSQHDWAPPRFCDSPTSDLESRQTKSSSRSKRGRSSSNTNQDNHKFTETRSSMHSKLRNSTMAKGRRTSNSSSTGRKTPPSSNERITSSGKRKVKCCDTDTVLNEEVWPNAKRTKSSHKNSSCAESEKNSHGLIACPEPNCSKKYKHINGLRYHRMHAHLHTKDSSNATPSKDITKQKLSSDSEHTFKKPLEDLQGREKSGKQNKVVLEENPEDSLPLSDRKDEKKEKSSKENKGLSSLPSEDASKSKDGGHHTKKNDQSTSQSSSCHSSAKPICDLSGKQNSVEESPKKSGAGSAGHSTNADLSVFDFNPSLEETDTGPTTPTKLKIYSPEKSASTHQKQSSQSSDSASSKSELSGSANVGMSDKTLSKESTEGGFDKKHEKEKLKAEKHKRREKSLKPLKSATRPIAPAPPVMPQQLIAIPISATIMKPGTMAPTQATTVTVTAMPAVTTKLTTVGGSNLKPIQPKPTVMGEPSPVNPSLNSLKEKKQKLKKKKDKDKEKEKPKEKEKEKKCDKEKKSEKPSGESYLSEVMKGSEPRPKVTYVSPVPETNILKQALTSSVSPLDLMSPHVTQVSSTEGGLLPSPPKDLCTKDVPKPSSLATQPPAKTTVMGIHPGTTSIPEIPKLISVSQTVNTSLPSYSVAPNYPKEPRTNAMAVSSMSLSSMAVSSMAEITKTVQSPKTVITSIPAIEAMSVGEDSKGVDSCARKAESDKIDSVRKTSSPAYSDISDEGGEPHSGVFHSHSSEASRIPHGLTGSDVYKMSSLSLLGTKHEERPLQTSATLSVATQEYHLLKTVSSQGTGNCNIEGSISERKEETVSGNSRPPFNGHYPLVPPYFMGEPKHAMKGSHQYKQPFGDDLKIGEQKQVDKRQVGPSKGLEQPKHTSKLEGRPNPDPNDLAIPSIHSEETVRVHETNSEMSQRAQIGVEKIPSTQSKKSDFQVPSTGKSDLGSTVEWKEKETKDLKQSILDRTRETPHTSDSHAEKTIKERKEHSTSSESKLHDHRSSASKLETERRPSPHGQRLKPSRSVSPGYRNTSMEEKSRYSSSSPSRSKPDTRGEGMPSPQNGMQGFPNGGYIPSPYMQYGAVAYDPSHPAFNPSHSPFSSMVAYPTLLPSDVPYPASHMVNRTWQGAEGKERTGHSKEPPASSSSSLSIPSTSRTSEAHERPTKALDMFAHGNDSYSRHRSRSGSPDRTSRPPSSSAPKANSPVTSKSPPRTSMVQDPRGEMARRQEAHAAFILHQQMLHQHLHTHQHTHLGMGYPGMVQPYDPYVMASHQAAAAATGVNPFAVRRE